MHPLSIPLIAFVSGGVGMECGAHHPVTGLVLVALISLVASIYNEMSGI